MFRFIYNSKHRAWDHINKQNCTGGWVSKILKQYSQTHQFIIQVWLHVSTLQGHHQAFFWNHFIKTLGKRLGVCLLLRWVSDKIQAKVPTNLKVWNIGSVRPQTGRDSTSNLDITYLLTPWSRVLLEKLTGLQLVTKFPVFYGTRRFLTALTSASQLSLSWASPIQS
jgi:hypothetical protein